MTRWIRFENNNCIEFGSLEGETITIFNGDMFDRPINSGKTVLISDVKILTPTRPTKMPALWNNYHTMADKMRNSKPTHPLYFFKSANSFAATGEIIRRPEGYDGKIVYEGTPVDVNNNQSIIKEWVEVS